MNDNSILWYLEGELRDNSPWIIPLHDNFSIGRLENSDLILSSGSVSRRHARMSISNGELYIQDLKSSNGTFVNGIRQGDQSLLRNGDLLKIGASEFKVVEGSPSDRIKDSHTVVGEMDDDKNFALRYNLSERESEILYFLVRGYNLQDIGEKLFISPGTVKNHVLKIYKKTDCHSRIELSTLFSKFESKT